VLISLTLPDSRFILRLPPDADCHDYERQPSPMLMPRRRASPFYKDRRRRRAPMTPF